MAVEMGLGIGSTTIYDSQTSKDGRYGKRKKPKEAGKPGPSQRI